MNGSIITTLQQVVAHMVERGIPFEDALADFERCFILKVLAENKGNVSEAARRLGIHRNTVMRRLREYKQRR